MNPNEAISIIRKEISCVSRNDCKREECQNCDLVMQDEKPIIEAFNMAIQALEDIAANRADVEFLAWCFKNQEETMNKLLYKYNKEGKIYANE